MVQLYLYSCLLLVFTEFHLVILPKQDDPKKAIVAACTEKQLIKLAAKELLNVDSSKNGEFVLL